LKEDIEPVESNEPRFDDKAVWSKDPRFDDEIDEKESFD